jgi:hypothetical protein
VCPLEKRVLRRIFGPERGLVAGGSRKVDSEELHNLDFLTDIFRIIKTRMMSKACSMHEKNLKERYNYERISVDVMIILQWILQRQHQSTDWIHLAQDREKGRAPVNTVMNLQFP